MDELPHVSTVSRTRVRRESLLMNLAKCFFLVCALLAFVGTIYAVAVGRANDVSVAAGCSVACFLGIMARIMQAEQFRH